MRNREELVVYLKSILGTADSLIEELKKKNNYVEVLETIEEQRERIIELLDKESGCTDDMLRVKALDILITSRECIREYTHNILWDKLLLLSDKRKRKQK